MRLVVPRIRRFSVCTASILQFGDIKKTLRDALIICLLNRSFFDEYGRSRVDVLRIGCRPFPPDENFASDLGWLTKFGIEDLRHWSKSYLRIQIPSGFRIGKKGYIFHLYLTPTTVGDDNTGTTSSTLRNALSESPTLVDLRLLQWDVRNVPLQIVCGLWSINAWEALKTVSETTEVLRDVASVYNGSLAMDLLQSGIIWIQGIYRKRLLPNFKAMW